jgi:branched-chain amino acid transport system substrate-binding protein
VNYWKNQRGFSALVFSFIVLGTSLILSINQVKAVTYSNQIENASQTYPFVVSLWDSTDDGESWAQFCSGVLIKPDLVLTAAHCSRAMSENSYQVAAQIGSDEFGPFPDSSNWFSVAAMWWSPRYSVNSFANDVGLMALSSKVNSNIAKPLNLPNSLQLLSVQNVKKYLLLGWGVDQNGDNPTVLQGANVQNEQSAANKFWMTKFNPSTMIAAGSYNKTEKVYAGACNGDSGAPLIAESNKKTVLLGIVSWSALDCDVARPTIFTRVGYYLKDIAAGEIRVRNSLKSSGAQTSKSTGTGTSLGLPGTPTPTPSPASNTTSGLNLPTVVIGIDLPLQGSSFDSNNSTINAIQLYLEQMQYHSKKYRIELKIYDDATQAAGSWDAARCAANAQEHVANKNEVAVIGTYNSGCSKIEVPILNQASDGPMMMVSHANTNPGLTKAWNPGEPNVYYPNGYRNYARVIGTDENQAIAAAQFAKSIGVNKVYILNDTQTYGQGVAQAFTTEAKKIGLTVLSSGPSGEGWDARQSDYIALMTKIKAVNPDMVYLGGIFDNNGGQLIKDKVAVLGDNNKVKLMGPDGFTGYPDLNRMPEAQGMYLTFSGLGIVDLLSANGNGNLKKFISSYSAKYGVNLVGSYPIYGVTALQAILQALDQSDGTRKSVTQQFFTGEGISVSGADSITGQLIQISTLSGDLLHPGITIERIANMNEESYGYKII